MRPRLAPLLLALTVITAGVASSARATPAYTNFESAPVRPVAMSPDGSRLFVANIPDGHLEIFDIAGEEVQQIDAVPVGLEPVAVAARSADEVWVVNHLSDSVSIVDLSGPTPVVRRTLMVGDEPRDIVFAGPQRSRAFITTAHRGQNVPYDPQFFSPSAGRADVWVFDATQASASTTGEPETILHLFSDTPRALAVTDDGKRVYAASFLSGNGTAIVEHSVPCIDEEACAIPFTDGHVAPGNVPPPHSNIEGLPAPRQSLVVKQDSSTGAFEDELGRDWSGAIPYSLPDYDVFAIDAAAPIPYVVDRYSGVGTVLFNMAVQPQTGRVFVTNTEAINERRFAPAVRGAMHRARLTIIDPSLPAVRPHALNPHIDYDEVPSPPDVSPRSLATPLDLVFSSDGETAFLAAFGSSRIAAVSVADLENGQLESVAPRMFEIAGGGPCGLVLDESRQRLFVLSRFENALVVIDVASGSELQRFRLHNPESFEVREGRAFLYDARLTSSNGEASCASCHVFGHWDALAWDLGDPAGFVFRRSVPDAVTGGTIDAEFHPMKGALATQSLRGMAGHGAMHWRGDRAGIDLFDEASAFAEFNHAFVDLLGRAEPLTAEQLARFTEFALGIMPPPNPNRRLDNSLREAEAAGLAYFTEADTTPCRQCHALEPAMGYFGTAGLFTNVAPRPQAFKIPQLRFMYEKVGYTTIHVGCAPNCDFGPSIRGFGGNQDGALSIFRSEFVPSDSTMDLLLVFPTNLAPIVGQQLTVGHASDTPGSDSRFDLLVDRARRGECDLVAKGTSAGKRSGWSLFDGQFIGDRENGPALSPEQLEEWADRDGTSLTLTCTPPGSGRRSGIDRDLDGYLDGDERDAGARSDHADDTPRTGCLGDCDGTDDVAVDELLRGIAIALGSRPVSDCYRFDPDGDEQVTVDALVGAVARALYGCRPPE